MHVRICLFLYYINFIPSYITSMDSQSVHLYTTTIYAFDIDYRARKIRYAFVFFRKPALSRFARGLIGKRE